MPCLFAALLWLYQPTNAHNLQIKPFDFQNDRNGYHFNNINQMETDGRLIYIASRDAPYIVVLDGAGKLVKKIGRAGSGPGEFGRGILGISVRKRELWALDLDRRNALLGFVDGTYQSRIELHSHPAGMIATDLNVFAFSENEVVFPCSPATGQLAIAYGREGGRQGVGEILFDRRDADLLRRIPAMNDTFWLHDDERWYALFLYYPLIMVYDRNFKPATSFPIDWPDVQNRHAALMDWAPEERGDQPRVLFSDVKLHGAYLYVLSGGRLYCMDKTNGALQWAARFVGDAPEFERRRNLTLHFFCVLDDGRAILGHPALMWDHDLWQVVLPNAGVSP